MSTAPRKSAIPCGSGGFLPQDILMRVNPNYKYLHYNSGLAFEGALWGGVLGRAYGGRRYEVKED
jgi:hypothetical protein